MLAKLWNINDKQKQTWNGVDEMVQNVAQKVQIVAEV